MLLDFLLGIMTTSFASFCASFAAERPRLFLQWDPPVASWVFLLENSLDSKSTNLLVEHLLMAHRTMSVGMQLARVEFCQH